MTDSEEEYEVDDQHRVGFAAEVACIIAIGCVAGLKGFSKMKKGGVSSDGQNSVIKILEVK